MALNVRIARHLDSGSSLPGTVVAENKFLGIANLNQLESVGILRPSSLARIPQRALKKGTPAIVRRDRARKVRELVQRSFDAPRKRRAVAYARYISAVEYGDMMGGTPPLTLWCARQCDIGDNDSSLIVPHGETVIAIDGETQLEARYILAEGNGDIEANSDSRNTIICFVLYHGIDEVAAAQILHDVNSYAKPIPERKLAGFNFTGRVSVIASKAIEIAGLRRTDVRRGTDSRRGNFVFELDQVLESVLGALTRDTPHIKGNDIALYNLPSSGINHSDIADTIGSILFHNKTNDDARGAPSLVWRAAGAKAMTDGKATAINWRGGLDAYESTKSIGRGGARMSPSERLAIILDAM